MRFIKRPFAFAAMFTFVLTAVSLYILLDTFVIAREYEATSKADIYYRNPTGNKRGSGTEPGSDYLDKTDPSIPYENCYYDDNISIVITEYREYDTTIYVADIRISDIVYLKSAFAKRKYGRNLTETVSDMSETEDAILSINGDYYGAQRSGYVIRNGIIYRTNAYSYDKEDLVIYADGSFGIIKEGTTNTSKLIKDGALQVYSFGPALLVDGDISVGENDEVKHAMESNPRTAIGMIEPLHYVFIVSDGRTDESKGLTLYELASFAQELGVETAYNLDGGGSSTMYFNGRIVNIPTDGKKFGERKVSDIVYIGY